MSPKNIKQLSMHVTETTEQFEEHDLQAVADG